MNLQTTLKKKLKNSLKNKELEENPTTGTPLGNDVYKIRLAIVSKNKGKSGGARVISFVKIIDETVYYPSTTKVKKILSPTKKLKLFWKGIFKKNIQQLS